MENRVEDGAGGARNAVQGLRDDEGVGNAGLAWLKHRVRGGGGSGAAGWGGAGWATVNITQAAISVSQFLARA